MNSSLIFLVVILVVILFILGIASPGGFEQSCAACPSQSSEESTSTSSESSQTNDDAPKSLEIENDNNNANKSPTTSTPANSPNSKNQQHPLVAKIEAKKQKAQQIELASLERFHNTANLLESRDFDPQDIIDAELNKRTKTTTFSNNANNVNKRNNIQKRGEYLVAPGPNGPIEAIRTVFGPRSQ